MHVNPVLLQDKVFHFMHLAQLLFVIQMKIVLIIPSTPPIHHQILPKHIYTFTLLTYIQMRTFFHSSSTTISPRSTITLFSSGCLSLFVIRLNSHPAHPPEMHNIPMPFNFPFIDSVTGTISAYVVDEYKLGYLRLL